MKPNKLILALFFTLQMTVAGTAFAWSPLDSVEDAVEKWYGCDPVVTASDETGQTKPKQAETEEEPDCD